MGLRKERNANLLLKGYQGLNLATHKDNTFIVIIYESMTTIARFYMF